VRSKQLRKGGVPGGQFEVVGLVQLSLARRSSVPVAAWFPLAASGTAAVAASTTNTAIAPDFRTIILRTIVILAGFTSTCFVSVRRRGGKSNCAARERGPETSGAITQATSQGAKDNLPPSDRNRVKRFTRESRKAACGAPWVRRR
jgi:hypothetical protein